MDYEIVSETVNDQNSDSDWQIIRKVRIDDAPWWLFSIHFVVDDKKSFYLDDLFEAKMDGVAKASGSDVPVDTLLALLSKEELQQALQFWACKTANNIQYASEWRREDAKRWAAVAAKAANDSANWS